MSDLKARIRLILPDFNKYDELIPKLRELGVSKPEYLEYVTFGELVPPLTVIQAKILQKEFSGRISHTFLNFLTISISGSSMFQNLGGIFPYPPGARGLRSARSHRSPRSPEGTVTGVRDHRIKER